MFFTTHNILNTVIRLCFVVLWFICLHAQNFSKFLLNDLILIYIHVEKHTCSKQDIDHVNCLATNMIKLPILMFTVTLTYLTTELWANPNQKWKHFHYHSSTKQLSMQLRCINNSKLNGLSLKRKTEIILRIIKYFVAKLQKYVR